MTQLFVLPLAEAARLEAEARRWFPARAKRADRMRKPEDRLRCLGAGVLLHAALQLEEEQIQTTEHGKPFAPQKKLLFNLSHSGEYIVLAVGSAEVGVDVQQIGAVHEGVAKRCFTAEELSWYRGDRERFFTVWTLKESVSKAVGLGLGLPFDSFSVLPLLTGQSILINDRQIYGLTLSLPGHALAVCSTEPFDQTIEPAFLTAETIGNQPNN